MKYPKFIWLSLAIAMISFFLIMGIVYSASCTITDNKFTNATAYDTFPGFNITTTTNQSACDYYWNETITNLTIDVENTTFVNASAFAAPPETAYGKWHNITYICYDGLGNTSQYVEDSSNYIYVAIDNTNPTCANEDLTIEDATSGGNYINFTFNTSDKNPNTYWVKIYHPDDTTGTKSATYKSGTENRWVEANLANTELSQDGKYYLEANARDDVSRNGTGTNQTYLVSHLVAGEWNQIVINNNTNLSDISSMVPNITHVAIYDNRIGYKNFTTFTVGTATHGDVIASCSLNATYIKTNEDVAFIRPYYNTYETTNITLWTGGWNYIGMVNDKTLNETMYADVYNNATVGSGNTTNVTYTSWFNSTSGLFCTARRGFTVTSCPGFDVTDITARPDDGLWILTNQNLTMNRSAM